jgi:putative ABC transport system substrate-binding protein
MRRREFIKLIAGAAFAQPLAARAQPPAMPLIGFFNSATPQSFAKLVDAYREGLAAAGFVESKRVDEFENMSDEELRQYIYENKELDS